MPGTVKYPARPNRLPTTVSTERMRERHIVDHKHRSGLIRTACGRFIAANTRLDLAGTKPLCERCTKERT